MDDIERVQCGKCGKRILPESSFPVRGKPEKSACSFKCADELAKQKPLLQAGILFIKDLLRIG
ncbi:hypothetical protein A3A03_00170 [Candidatus Nomurabacteria bacterium RIFCSPLOWO2_01_FULL_40_18]|uniref:Uncharacterized protein n=1 Tax=Candidatus Nomurabacteria bacterium RIFCSPLOWO2_01_FULL_40_18 TaxID=1801773 RepID=A0A1F6XKT5_9BACT|nr:MAG: hypothetical protein A3A03_00170 [Candidatus Nomurabacteria bacterium RIFCSPLOWO2_01_FULL_40_18]